MKEVPSGRRRLSPSARRRQLLEVGLGLLDRDPQQPLSPRRVADLAGTVPGLLYRYFPDRGAFTTEVLSVAAERLVDATSPRSASDALRDSLRAEVGFARRHTGLWRALHHRPEAAGARARWLAGLERRLSPARGAGPPSARARIQLRGWLGFRQAAIDGWLDDPSLSEEALLDLLVDAASPWLTARARPRDRKPRVRLMGSVRRERRDGAAGAEGARDGYKSGDDSA